MAKRRETVGTGITARQVVRYSGEDMAPAFAAFASRWNTALAEGGGQFSAVVLKQERICASILADAARRPRSRPFPKDSIEDYAKRILRQIHFTKSNIAQGDADSAARDALAAGRLITEAHMKGAWEKYAMSGLGNKARLNAAARHGNQKRRAATQRRDAELQAMAAAIWQRNGYLTARDVARRIVAKLGEGNPETIRRKIKK
jgi:hypothetical protein